jgi:hypothetical protein
VRLHQSLAGNDSSSACTIPDITSFHGSAVKQTFMAASTAVMETEDQACNMVVLTAAANLVLLTPLLNGSTLAIVGMLLLMTKIEPNPAQPIQPASCLIIHTDSSYQLIHTDSCHLSQPASC